MKDYYKILGVEEEASEEEIRARWIELTKYYHPDVRRTKEGEERIKEINEAYEILKSESTRFQYDFERDLKRSFIKRANRHQERRTSIRRIVIPSSLVALFLIVGFIFLRSGRVAPPPKSEALHETENVSEKIVASRTPPVEINPKAQSGGTAPKEIKEAVILPETKKEVIPPENQKMASLPPPRSPTAVERELEQKKEPPQRILLESEVEASVEAEKESKAKEKPAPQVVTKSQIPAMKEVSKEVPKEIPRQVAKEIPKEAPKEAAKEVVKEVPKELPKEAAKEVPKEIPRQVAKEIRKEVPKEAAKEVVKEVPKELPKETAKEVPKEIPRQVAKEIPKEVPKEVAKEVVKKVPKELPKEAAKEVPKEVPKEVVKEVPKEAPKEVARVTLHPGEKFTIWTRGERVVSSRPSPLAREEEIRQFFSDYVDRYNRKDIDGFLSFFSSKAVQNQTDGLKAISNLYTKFIDQSQDLRYQIEGMKIEISQHKVDVRARFRIDQKLKKDGEEKVWKGNAHWVLVKEEGRLKISSLDYQNEKSP
jgi:ketosteroid isomerase-like protein